MKKLIILLISLAVVVFVCDRLIGHGLWWTLQHTNSTMAAKTRHLAFETDAEMVALGTSKCYHHYNPQIIEDSLGMTFYNGGMDGTENIYSHFIALSLMLKRHQPKYVILDAHYADFLDCGSDNYTSIIKFAPYYGYSNEADSVFALDPTEFGYQISHLYRYNNQLFANLFGLAKDKKNEDRGYVGWGGSLSPSLGHSYYNPNLTDSTKLHFVERFITLCRENGTEPIIVVSPNYATVDSLFYSPLAEVASRYNVNYLNYHDRQLFVDSLVTDFFYDQQHLNRHGSELFSSQLSSDLKQIIKSE